VAFSHTFRNGSFSVCDLEVNLVHVVQGLSAPRVQLERLERMKQHKVALHSRQALPRLARLIDYIISCAAVATLDTGLSDLRSLLDNCGIIRCQVCFNDDGSLLVEPKESTVNLAIGKQVGALVIRTLSSC
jgi:hypothetical protein